MNNDQQIEAAMEAIRPYFAHFDEPRIAAREIAAAALAAAHPTITTAEDLAALAEGSIIQMNGVKAPFLLTCDGWESTRTPGKPVYDYVQVTDYFPATVLYWGQA